MINFEQLGYFLPQGHLFKNVNLQINPGEKIGLVGKNGAGKSTLLKIITGKIQASEGKIHIGKGNSVGILTQDIVILSEIDVLNYVLKSNERLNHIETRLNEINKELIERTDYESTQYLKMLDELSDLNHEFNLLEGNKWEEKVQQTLFGLGFTSSDLQKKINELSGGWKMRAELAKILVNNPSILLLDEPTNHLDIVSISWLEGYLKKFEGIVILISHDRLFLDNVTKRTLDIQSTKIADYPYPYSKYKEIRQEELERLESAKKQQDKEIKETEELINKFRAKSSKAAFAQSLIKKLDKTERIELEKDVTTKIRLTFPLSVQPGKWVLQIENLGKSYGDRELFKQVNITVGRGEKIALLGPNGVGKSTLLKAIMTKINFEGKVEYGHNVNISYFAQDQAEKLDPNKTVFETVDDVAIGDVRKDIRTILGSFLFSGEDIDKKVGMLSGGERTRLALCQLLFSPSNFLILDEPTNHLDIQSKEILKRALIAYEGSFIIVSHDREFVDGLTNRIWDIEDQQLKIHHFELNEYLDYKINKQPKIANPETIKPEVEKSPNSEKEKKGKNNSSNERKIKKLEDEIEKTENEIRQIEEVLSLLEYDENGPYQEKIKELERNQDKLETLMNEWSVLLS